MSRISVQSTAASVVTSQNTASIIQFGCLYTHDVNRKKQKRWKDGRLRFHTFNKRIMVYDLQGNYIGDSHWRETAMVQDGDELNLDKGVLVQVGELVDQVQQDLTELLDRRKDSPRPVPDSKAEPVHQSPVQRDAYWAQDQPKPLSVVLGPATGRKGRAMMGRSPFQNRHNISQQEQRTNHPRVGTTQSVHGRMALDSSADSMIQHRRCPEIDMDRQARKRPALQDENLPLLLTRKLAKSRKLSETAHIIQPAETSSATIAQRKKRRQFVEYDPPAVREPPQGLRAVEDRPEPQQDRPVEKEFNKLRPSTAKRQKLMCRDRPSKNGMVLYNDDTDGLRNRGIRPRPVPHLTKSAKAVEDDRLMASKPYERAISRQASPEGTIVEHVTKGLLAKEQPTAKVHAITKQPLVMMEPPANEPPAKEPAHVKEAPLMKEAAITKGPPDTETVHPTNAPRPAPKLRRSPLKKSFTDPASKPPKELFHKLSKTKSDIAPVPPLSKELTELGPWSREAFDLFGWEKGDSKCIDKEAGEV